MKKVLSTSLMFMYKVNMYTLCDCLSVLLIFTQELNKGLLEHIINDHVYKLKCIHCEMTSKITVNL